MSDELDDTMSAEDLDSIGAGATPMDLPLGAVFAGRYLVDAMVGRGGMGAVYRVRDEKLDEVVALKLLTLASERAVDRFLSEVRLARRVTHPNVARTHDLGEHDGVHFLTMEYVRGTALDALLERGGPLPPERVMAIGADIARGLSAAHEAGVVHRDLKPANVLLSEDGRVVITDFGIARAVSGDVRNHETGALVGTPHYMAPEQVSGRPVDARADLYALGLILYELATGALPFDGDTAIAVALARLQHPPVDPREHGAVPDPLANLILRCLAREPEGRPGRAADVQHALEALGTAPGSAGRSATTPSLSSLYAPLAPAVGALAVLPFAYRGDAEHDYLGEGLAEELIDVLSRTKGLKLLALGATKRFADARDPQTIGKELGASSVVDGTVQLSGDRVRLSARLVDAADGVQQWSERFDGRFADVFELQEKLARRVAEALRVELGASSAAHGAPPEAVELYLRARKSLRGGIMTGAEDAVEMLERAIALAPAFGVAKAAHAIASIRAWWGNARDQSGSRGERARRSVARAREEVPELAETHHATAMLAVQSGEYHDAAQALRRALDIAPTLAEAHQYLGELQLEGGRGKEGRQRLQTALELDPTLFICHLALARYALLDGDLERHRHHERALVEAFGPQHFPVLVSRFRWALYQRDEVALREHLDTMRMLGTDPADRMAMLCEVALGEGSIESAKRMFEEAPSWLANPRFTSLMMQVSAEVFGAAGETELSLTAVTRAAESILIDVEWITRCPLLHAMRDDPRFEAAQALVSRRAANIWRR